MERLALKTYDDVEDRSPLYCVCGAVLIGVMAWRELSQTGEMGLRFWSMLLTLAAFVVGAMILKTRHRITIEVQEEAGGKGELKISFRGGSEQVILESQLAYVKLELDRVKIHFYEGDDLSRTSFSIKSVRKRRVKELIEVLEKWQV